MARRDFSKALRDCFVVVALAILLLGAVRAQAGSVPAGWTCTGNCGTSGASGASGAVTLSPAGNPSYHWISTAGGIAGVGQIASAGGTDGSTLATPVFAATAGDPLKFYFNYVTSDGGNYSDYAWAGLFNPSNRLVALLFTTRTRPRAIAAPMLGLPMSSPGMIPFPKVTPFAAGATMWSPLGRFSGTCFAIGCGDSGWTLSEYTIPTAGDYYLQVGVTNWGDILYDSGLAISGVSVNGAMVNGLLLDPVSAPEPVSLALLGAGLAGLGAIHRWRGKA